MSPSQTPSLGSSRVGEERLRDEPEGRLRGRLNEIYSFFGAQNYFLLTRRSDHEKSENDIRSFSELTTTTPRTMVSENFAIIQMYMNSVYRFLHEVAPADHECVNKAFQIPWGL